jgi:hypothetical protein
MAEDTNLESRREIVYYKGIKYYLLEKKDGGISKLEQVDNPSKGCICATDKLLTEEEYKKKLEKGSFMIDNYNNTEKRTRYM